MLTPDRPPPEDYYQNNCRVLLEFVCRQYAGYDFSREFGLLQQAQAFLQAGDAAQRLFARLLTRKGPLFRTDSLQYMEVGDTEAALRELRAAGLVDDQPAVAADQVLKLLRKNELLQTWAFAADGKQARKATLIDAILSRYPDRKILQHLAPRLHWIALRRPQVWYLFRLLYFGEQVQDWSAFVLRDLGMVNYLEMPLPRPRLSSSAQLHTELRYRQLSQLSRRLHEHPEVAERLAAELVSLLAADCEDRYLQRRRNKTLLRIAQWQEQQGAGEAALHSYQRVALHPARERRARILKRLARHADCQALLAEIEQAPLCDEERQFVQRFGRRRAGFQPPTTQMSVSTVSNAVEEQALQLLLRDGGWGAHVENSLIRTLTGLLYWPVIFAPLEGAFTNPFQTGPNDLYYDDFAQARAGMIAGLEDKVAGDAQLRRHLLLMHDTHYGYANHLVNWNLLDNLSLPALLDVIPAAHIRRLGAFLIRNLGRRRSGLPDLFVAYPDGGYELVEVKGPNDQLQPGQRVWLQHLQQMQIPCRVLKLKLAAEPMDAG